MFTTSSIARMPLFSKSACSRGLKSLTIYGFPLSQPTRSVLLLCKENSIPYTFKLVDALKGENLKPEFRKIHPAGLVPAIEDGEGFVLGESGAILQYLSEVHGLNSWYPSDFKQRAKVNFWLHWNHNKTRVRRRSWFPSYFPLNQALRRLSKRVSKHRQKL